MKERLMLIAVVIMLFAALKLYMPDTAAELQSELRAVFDPEGVVSAMGHGLADNSLTESFSIFDDGKSEY